MTLKIPISYFEINLLPLIEEELATFPLCMLDWGVEGVESADGKREVYLVVR